jgi:hypothetical protein
VRCNGQQHASRDHLRVCRLLPVVCGSAGCCRVLSQVVVLARVWLPIRVSSRPCSLKKVVLLGMY